MTPYVVTKKTVFKWQESFWVAMKEVFDRHYKSKFEVLMLHLWVAKYRGSNYLRPLLPVTVQLLAGCWSVGEEWWKADPLDQ